MSSNTAAMRLLLFLVLVLAMPVCAHAAERHVKTMLFYGLDGVNTSIPASYMASHTWFVESDIGESDRAQAFKRAGGHEAMAYTDPGFVPYCYPPFDGTPGRCEGPIGSLNPPESAWLHDMRGARIHKFVDPHFHYQEALNPAAPAAQAAYRSYTEKLLSQAPDLDWFMADDSGGTLRGADGTADSGAYWNFNARPAEIRDDRTFVAGREAMFRAAARPVFVNGVGPDQMPSYGGAFVRAPNVAGLMFENCFQDYDTGLVGDKNDKFRKQNDGLLATIADKRYALCMFGGKATPATRIYDVASFWLAYDPQWSIAAVNVTSPDTFTVFPEYEIVPTEPRETAQKSIVELRTATGTYVRRFGACYQNGVPIGPCAAVVNPTDSDQPLPPELGANRRSLVVDNRSEYTGGRATWQHEVPHVLPAMSAVIVAA